MKHLILISAFFLASYSGTIAQTGKVIYQQKISFQVTLDSTQMIQLGGINLPTETTTETILYFSPLATLYEPVKKETDPSTEDNGFSMIVMDDQFQIYTCFADSSVTEQRDFMGRTFLIRSEMDTLKWKPGNHGKEIAGYKCMDATTEIGGDTIIVWFTPDIPMFSGPEGLGGLPGLILEVERDHGKTIITAGKLSFETVNPEKITRPTKGKKVSKKEFNAIVDQKMKEMGTSNGENVIIEIRTGN